MHTRRMLAVLAIAVMLATGLVASATPASATSPCGSGYGLVGSYALSKAGIRKGTLQVYYNSSSGKNCALTYGYGAWANTRNWKSVYISRANSGTTSSADSGYYIYYAGPVYVYARGTCIDVAGEVADAFRALYSVHCG